MIVVYCPNHDQAWPALGSPWSSVVDPVNYRQLRGNLTLAIWCRFDPTPKRPVK